MQTISIGDGYGMEDYVKHLLAQAERVLSTHCNENNPHSEEAVQIYTKLVNLQAQYAEYIDKFNFTKV